MGGKNDGTFLSVCSEGPPKSTSTERIDTRRTFIDKNNLKLHTISVKST